MQVGIVQTSFVQKFQLMALDDIKYMFVLQLPEDKTKNYIGILDSKYKYQSFNLFLKSKVITPSVMKTLKKKLLSLGITAKTHIVLSNTIAEYHPIFLVLSLARKFIPFKFNTVAIEKAFKRITAYHISYSLGREFTIQDYNKIYKKLLQNEDCAWISKDEDASLRNTSKANYRIQKILRTCMYYMCVKQYYLSRRH